jgi:hypothetical protein
MFLLLIALPITLILLFLIAMCDIHKTLDDPETPKLYYAICLFLQSFYAGVIYICISALYWLYTTWAAL